MLTISIHLDVTNTSRETLQWIVLFINRYTFSKKQFHRTMQPLNAQRRMFDRLNKTLCGESKVTVAQSQEKSRSGILKKIISISSIKQEVKKILLKYLDNGADSLDEQSRVKILEQSKNILDNDRQKKLSEDLQALAHQQNQRYSTLFKVIRELVISPIEKSYISKIEKEIKEDEALEVEIREIEDHLEQEKAKKIREYQSQKSGYMTASAKNLSSGFKEVENFENKLMRANQRLNQMASNNNKLREKINQLRKEKNAMEDIYGKLKKQLETKKQNVEKTIKFAGEAYCARNKAEEDLKNLKEQSEIRKQQFKQQCEKLNNEIQHDLRFKQFIKSKEIQREHLEQLEKQIEENQSHVEVKKEENRKIEQEYKKSLEKQAEIKRAFEKIKHEIGYNDAEGDNKDLLNVFIKLYEKNIIMKDFVKEITQEVEDLEIKIEKKKEEIQKMYLKGTGSQDDRAKLSEEYKSRFQFFQKKKAILDIQYEKSVSTIQTIKKYLEDIFEEIGINPDVLDKLKCCSLNEENLTEFLGELEKKGLDAISHYGKLVSEQLKAEKGSTWEIQKQIDELNNIITLENVNTMNNSGGSMKVAEYPSELLIKLKEEKGKEDQFDKPLTLQDFKKYALESLEQYQKKQIPKEKHFNKKYNVAPMLKMSKKK